MGLLLAEGLGTDGFVFDTALAGYLLDSTASDYAPERLARKYLGRDETGAGAVYALYTVLDAKLTQAGMDGDYTFVGTAGVCRIPAGAGQCDIGRVVY